MSIRSLWPAYLTLFVIVCAGTAGFTLGVYVNQRMALTSITKLETFTRDAIKERGQ